MGGIDQDGRVEGVELASSNKHIKIHLYMEQFSLKTNSKLQERLVYKPGCKKEPHGIR